MRKLIWLFVAILSFSTVQSAAQQTEQGVYPGISYDSDVLGSVNLTTGSLAIDHVVLHLPQLKGLAWGDLHLRYNSPAWDLESSCNDDGDCYRTWVPVNGSSFSVEPQIDTIPTWTSQPIWPLYQGEHDPNFANAQLIQAVTANGQTHDMVPVTNGYRSIDATNLFLNATGTQLIDGNGTTYTFPSSPGSFIVGNYGGGGLPTTITNAHGQSWSPPTSTIQYQIGYPDSLGRTWSWQSSSDFSGCTGPLPITAAWIYYLQDQSGQQHPILKECLADYVQKTNLSILYNCYDPGGYPCTEYVVDWSPVQSIVLTADGSWNSGNAWTFLYGRTDFTSPSYINYGLLTGIQTPQGGTVTYSWVPSTISSTFDAALSVSSRIDNAGDGSGDRTTNFAWQYSGNNLLATVTAPDSTSVVHSFAGLAEIGTTYKDQSGTVLKSVTNTFTTINDPYNLYYPFSTNFPTGSTVTWPNGVSCATSETYPNTFSYSIHYVQTGNPHPPVINGTGNYGEVGTQYAYDCGSGGTGALLSYSQNSWMDSLYTAYFNKNLFGLLQQSSTYDGSGGLVSQTTYGYDQNGESGPVGDQTTVSNWLNTGGSLQASVYYDSTGQPVRAIDPSNSVTTFGSDPSNLVVTSTTNPPVPSGVSLQSTSTVDPFSYQVTNQTNVAGAVSTANYDEMFRPTHGTFENGATWEITYVAKSASSFAEVDATTQIDGNTNTTTKTVVDGFGRTIQSNQQTSNASQTGWIQQDTCYDQMGRVSFQSYPRITWSSTPAVHSCSVAGDTFSYDALGRLLNTTHQDGTYSTISYTGRATKTTDEAGVSRIVQVDGLGRPTIVCEISSNASMPGSGSPVSCGTDISGTGFLTTYSYNLATHTTTVTQGGQQRIFQSDSAGRPIYSSEPERGATNYSYSFPYAGTQNSGYGLQTTRTSPQANQTNSSVHTTTTALEDSIGRIVSIVYQNGNANLYSTPPKSFSYDTLLSPWYGVPLGYSKGRLVLATAGASGSQNSIQMANYDALGNAQSTVQCLPDWCGQSAHDVIRTYSYDFTGSQTQEQYLTQAASGSTISVNAGRSLSGDLLYLSGGQNNVGTLTDPNGKPVLLNITQSGPFGILSGQLGNGLGVAASYDALGRIQGGWVCSGGVTSPNCPGASAVYSFSSLSWTGSYLSGGTDSALGYSSSYSYDQFGRLASTNIGSGQIVFGYQYDRFGNRWSQTATGSGSGSVPQPSLSFNLVNNLTSNNQLVSGTCNPVTATQYCYDAAGNMIADGFHTYTYDADGNVVGIDGTQGVAGAAQFTYDAFNERVKSVSEGGTVQRYAYNLDGQRASTWNSSGVLVSANYYADGQPLAYYNNTDGYIHFQHMDWNGTVRVRTRYNGGSDGTYLSFPFGDGFSSTGSDSDPLHFGLLDRDYDSNTDHAQARQYSSTQGHWLSPDPYDGSYDFTIPQSLNRYVYASNNPLSLLDPSGEEDNGDRSNHGCNGAPMLGTDDTCYESYGMWGDKGGVHPHAEEGWMRAFLRGLGHYFSLPPGTGGDPGFISDPASGEPAPSQAQQKNPNAAGGIYSGGQLININLGRGISLAGTFGAVDTTGTYYPAAKGVYIGVYSSCTRCQWVQIVSRTGAEAVKNFLDNSASFGTPFYPYRYNNSAGSFFDMPKNYMHGDWTVGAGTFSAVSVLGRIDLSNHKFHPIGAIGWGYSVDSHGMLTPTAPVSVPKSIKAAMAAMRAAMPSWTIN